VLAKKKATAAKGGKTAGGAGVGAGTGVAGLDAGTNASVGAMSKDTSDTKSTTGSIQSTNSGSQYPHLFPLPLSNRQPNNQFDPEMRIPAQGR
jgi:hypothetical protein